MFNDSIQNRISPEREEPSSNLTNSTNRNCSSQTDFGYFSLSVNDASEQITSTINESSENNQTSQNNESSPNNDASKSNSFNSENTLDNTGILNSSEFSGTIQENSDDSLRIAESNLSLDFVEGIADEPDHFDDGLEDHEEETTNHEVSENINSSETVNGTKEGEVAENQPEALTNDENQSELVCQPKVNGDSNNDKSTENQDDEEEAAGNCKETDSGYRSGDSEDYEIPKRRYIISYFHFTLNFFFYSLCPKRNFHL